MLKLSHHSYYTKVSLFACRRRPNIPGCISTPKTCTESKELDHQQKEYEITLCSFLHFLPNTTSLTRLCKAKAKTLRPWLHKAWATRYTCKDW